MEPHTRRQNPFAPSAHQHAESAVRSSAQMHTSAEIPEDLQLNYDIYLASDYFRERHYDCKPRTISDHCANGIIAGCHKIRRGNARTPQWWMSQKSLDDRLLVAREEGLLKPQNASAHQHAESAVRSSVQMRDTEISNLENDISDARTSEQMHAEDTQRAVHADANKQNAVADTTLKIFESQLTAKDKQLENTNELVKQLQQLLSTNAETISQMDKSHNATISEIQQAHKTTIQNILEREKESDGLLKTLIGRFQSLVGLKDLDEKQQMLNHGQWNNQHSTQTSGDNIND